MEPARTIPNAVITGARGAAALNPTEFPFEIRGVPQGSYDLYPLFNNGAGIYTGRVAIEVGTENITNVKTSIQPGVELKFHVSTIGTPPPPPKQPNFQPTQQVIQMQIRPADNVPGPLTSGLIRFVSPDVNGVITIAGVPEARFFVPAILGLPADEYISEMRQGSRSIMDDTIINVGKEAPDPVEIVISRSGGTIAGTLEDAQHKPLPGVRVFLIPEQPRRKNLLLYKNANSTTNGVFNFQGVAPGAYKMFAWDNLPQGAEQNEEFISQYDGLGTRVVVSTGTPMSNVQVTLIRANRGAQ
jgi:hypothetical protein